ncbi:hypothetical protein BDP27DRAFT_1380944 [Rhodocollybia butyracea]|uniref:Alcohol acetyltransferase n=1 Tax=Rhodocollybia butyracea TaxID=206335 RepID=A0A9P5Q4D7_9AGAR|nr:hypothetical protein BDP27DRAFT_1380944 [Rhodocollybia butyracea]
MRLQNPACLERKLGDTEASYFLPSRESGVNDMYLHLGFSAQPHVVVRDRVALVWAILRLKHPLLASAVEMRNYEDIRFVFKPYTSPESALQDSNNNFEYRTGTKDELLHSYLNGARILSANRLSYLIVSQEPQSTDKSVIESPKDENQTNWDLMICTTHFVGDGMALHQFANDFFTLLASAQDIDELGLLMNDEWRVRYGGQYSEMSLPASLEERLPPGPTKFHQVASRVDFLNSQEKLVGGHSFPKRTGNERRTVVPTVAFDKERTGKMLKLCKAHSVSISSALFAICNIAWIKSCKDKPDLPTLMYSALNIRPYLSPDELNDSYWFIAISYFNVVLPGFLPASDIERTFWYRARCAKEQSTRAAKHQMIISRSREMAKERGDRARCWAKEDDDKANGIPKASPPLTATTVAAKAKPPSTALIGLSLLGNLDGTYKHAAFPKIRLHTLTTGSRQRSGAMLLFGYTFVGKLWVSLGYDMNGFEEGFVERFWGNVFSSIEELL